MVELPHRLCQHLGPAPRLDRVGILHDGRLLTSGSIEELKAELHVGWLEADEVANEGKRTLGIIGEARCGLREHGDSELAAIAARRGQPSLELFEIGKIEAFEKVELPDYSVLLQPSFWWGGKSAAPKEALAR